MKKILLNLIFIFTCLTFYAQTNYIDVIYLKNGSIIKGVIIEQIPNEKYTIKTADGSQFVFTVDEILKITKEEIDKKSNKETINPKTEGFVSDNFIGLAYDPNYGFGAGFMALTENGWRKNNYFLGLGLGMELYDGFYFTPTYLNFKYYIKNQQWSPYGFADLGYAYGKTPLVAGDSGGFLAGGGIGVKYYQTGNFSINGKFGIELQNYEVQLPLTHWVNGVELPLPYFYSKRKEMILLKFGVGISF